MTTSQSTGARGPYRAYKKTACSRAERRTRSSLEKRGYTEEEAAYYIAMSRSFLRQDRMNGPRDGRAGGPPWVRIGRSVRYLRDDLDAWLQRHRASPGR